MDLQSTEAVGQPIPGRTQAEEDLAFVLEFVDKSNAYREPFIQIWYELMDNYLVAPFAPGMQAIPRIGHPSIATLPTQRYARRAVLKDPESHQIVEGMAAQYLGLLFGSRDYVQATPVGLDDYEKARLLSRLIMSVMEAPGVYRTMYQTWKDSCILGTAVLEMGWESRSRQQISEALVLDENGRAVGYTFVPQDVVYREGPMIRQVDGWDFYPDPSGTRIQYDMMAVAKRFRITKAEAMALAEAGKYDKQAVMRAVDRKGVSSSLEGSYRERFELLQKTLPDKYGTMIGIELWGTVPYKHEDGASNRVITVINGEIVRSVINPHRNGAIPFKEIVANPLTGRFYGFSPSEANRFLQDFTDNLLMSVSDSVNLLTRPTLLMGNAFGGDPNRLRRREFDDIIPCGNPDAVKPLQGDLNAIEFAVAQIQRTKQNMRESAGSLDPVTQSLGADRQAATTTTEIVRIASQRNELQSVMSEREDMPFIGKMIHSMLRQFMPDDGAVAVLNGEPLQVSLRDIDFEADVRYRGSSQAQSKFQKVAQYRDAIAAIGPNMELIDVMPELFVRLLRDGMEIPDAEIIMRRAVARLQLKREQQMQAEMQMKVGASAPRSTQGNLGTPTGAAESEGQVLM